MFFSKDIQFALGLFVGTIYINPRTGNNTVFPPLAEKVPLFVCARAWVHVGGGGVIILSDL